MRTFETVDFKWPGLLRPAGDRLRLNGRIGVVLDRKRAAPYDAVYRPQALYSRALEGFHATDEAFLLQEVATDLPIYRPDTGPTDFHLHLPPGGFQLVLVTSGLFSFDYDGRLFHIGPGTAILQSAIVHRQLAYSWSGLPTEQNLAAAQSVVPDALSMGGSGKFIEAFVTEPATFPNPTIVATDAVDEAETPALAWCHPLHDRPSGAGFWLQDPLALDALYRPLTAGADGVPIRAAMPVFVRDLGLEGPSGRLVTGHVIASDPRDRAVLPKARATPADPAALESGEVSMHRVIRGSAAFRSATGQLIEMAAGDVVTAGRGQIALAGLAEDSQVLRLGLLEGLDALRRWTPAQRDEIDGLGGRIITRTARRAERAGGDPIGYLYT
ncbi:MAG: hypothetical protein U1E23_10540 [Reyranellaceae bacterium]